MKKVLVSVSSVAVGAMPLLALAQTYSGGGLGGLITWAIQILNALVPFLIALAVVWFIWNVFQYAIQGDEDKKKAAKGNIIWGVVAIFVMVSVWGLVGILQNTFNLNNAGANSQNLNNLIPRANQ